MNKNSTKYFTMRYLQGGKLIGILSGQLKIWINYTELYF